MKLVLQFPLMDTGSLGYLGIDYRYASLEEMEKLYFNNEDVRNFFEVFPFGSPIQELVILSTCNRVEFYFSAQDPLQAAQWLKHRIAGFKKLSTAFVEKTLKEKNKKKAMKHLFSVVSGVESMVFGENEILTQIKDAYQTAYKHKATQAFFNKVFQSAVAAGKRVRKETEISKGSYSVSSIAVDCLRHRFGGHFLDSKILVVGAGVMALRAVKKMKALNHTHLALTNRSEDRLIRTCEKFDLTPLPFSALRTELNQFDGVIVATSSPTYLMWKDHVAGVTKPLILIDLSVPRNVDPDVVHNIFVSLVTVEGLKETADRTIESRKQELSKIESIIQEEIDNIQKWLEFKPVSKLSKAVGEPIVG